MPWKGKKEDMGVETYHSRQGKSLIRRAEKDPEKDTFTGKTASRQETKKGEEIDNQQPTIKK